MSMLLEIYDAIADTAIPFTSAEGPVDVFGVKLDQTPNVVESADMPIRLLQPFGGRGDGRLDTIATAGAGVFTVDWGIADMLFYRAAAAGRGLEDVAEELVRYKAAYVSALVALRTARQTRNKWHLSGMVLTVDSFEWPAQSGRYYDGVISRLTITEIIP